MKQSSVLLNLLRRHLKRPVCVLLAVFFPFWTLQVQGATILWDADGTTGSPTGGTGTWDQTASNLWDNGGAMQAWTNAGNDTALFSGTAGTVTLGEAITAGGLTFTTTDYLITGDTLTLSDLARVDVAAFTHATIGSLIAGTSGLTKVGNGTLFLGNNSNSYTGDTVINAGALVITNEGQLGASTSTISINGIANTGNPGFTGGQLVVDGNSGPVTMTREISISGRGPGAVNASGGLVSVGSNIFNGDINLSGPASEGRFVATYGTTTVNGDVYLGASAVNYFLGNGNIIVNGQVSGFDTGTDRLIKSSGGPLASTLWLTNPNNDFRETIRPDSGTIRVSDNGALGVSTSNRAIDFASGGFLEIHTDAPNFDTRNVYIRNNINARMYATRAFDGSGLNETIKFGNLTMESGTLTFDNRNGYNFWISASNGAGGTTTWGSAANAAFVNNADGRLTFDGSIRHNEGTARTFTVGGNGNTRITGSYLGEGAGHALTKSGNGIFWLEGTASTYTGATNVNAGTLSIGSFGAINNNTAQLNIGATTVTGALEYTGAAETLTKNLRLTGTTGGAIILSNGTGPVTIAGTISATGAGIKTLTLGGSNTGNNLITSAIPDNSGTNTTSVLKFGSGTWALLGANTYTGSTTITEGILALADTFSGSSVNVLPDANSITFDASLFTNSAGGTFAYVGDGANASSETVGALVATAGAGTVAAVSGSGGSAALTFSSLGTISAGAGINFVTDAGSSITLTGASDTSGILDAHLFYNGADFASSSAVTAATYTTEATGASLVGGNTTPYLVNTADIAAQLDATINAGIKFNDTRALTLAAAQTLTINNGANTAGGILVTGGSTVTISGGSGITSGGSGDLVFRTDGAGDTLNLNTPILASSTGGWTKLGAGTLVLGAANAGASGTGKVSINEGVVQLGTGARLGATSMDVALRQGATLDLNGNSLGSTASSTGSIDELNGAGSIINSGALASLRVGNANASSLFTGTIAGAITLVKNGSGSFRIQGPQTFSGGVEINAGNYIVTSLADIGVASGLGTGDATNDDTNAASLVFNGGVLYYRGSDGTFYQPTDTPSVSINRLFTLAGNGTIFSDPRFGGPNRENVASGATLIFNNPGDVRFSGTGARTLTLRGDSNGDNEMNLRLTDNPNGGALSFTKSDGSLWILTNTGNDYTGNTTINGGVLRVGDDGSALTRTLPTTSALVLGLTTGSGVLQTKGVFDRSVAATATAGSVTWGGSTGGGGFAASTAPLVVNLGGAGATLQWGSGGFVGTGGTQTLFLSSNTSWADVDFRNGIDLNGGTRTIQVDDNGFTALDYATVSGVISNSTGTGALNVTGGGNLILGGANTYNGNTSILSSGALIVTSIGAAGATSSSLGTNVGGGSLNFTGNTTQQLLYVGSGETTTRAINFTTALSAARTYRIDSSGSGALVLNNFNNNKTGNFTLFMELRGINTDGNTINSVIGDGSGTAGLVLAKFDGGVWILGNTANTFTGGVRADGGLLGLAGSGSLGAAGVVTTGVTSGSSTTLTVSSTAGLTPGMYVNGNGIGYGDIITAISGSNVTLSTARTVAAGTTIQFGGLNISNGGIFATDPAGLTLSQPVFHNNNAGAVFAGMYDITLNGPYQMGTGNNDQTITNALENGAVLTVNGNLVNFKANTRTIFMRGFGSTVWNGEIQDATGANTTILDIRIGDNASFTLGGANTFTGGLILGQGTLIVNNTQGLGTAANTVQLNGGTFTSAIDLTGANAIQNSVLLNGNQATIAGSQNIELAGGLVNNNGNRFLLNELDPGKTLTISGTLNLSQNDTGRTLTIRGSGVTSITGVVANGGAGAGGLAFSGVGSLELTSAATATGTLTVNRNLVILSGTNGSWNNGTFALNPTGIIRLDNSGGDNPSGRLSSAGAFAGQGGTLDIIGDADGSAHNAGPLTLNSVQTYITMTDGSGGTGVNKIEFDSVSFPNTGSSLNLIGIADLGSINRVQFATDPTGNAFINGMMPRTYIGSDFATYDATTDANGEFGVKAFSGYNAGSINSAASTDTMDVTASVGLTVDKTVNAIKLNGTGISLSGADRTLTLSAAAILNTGGNNSLNVSLVQFAALTGHIQVATGTALDVNSTLLGTSGWAKAQGGTLNLNTPTFITSTTNLLNGTLKLNVGLNAMFPNQLLNMNAGSTLDLNGNVQFVAQLTDPGVLPGTGGTITSTGGAALLVTNMNGGSTTFATEITGQVSLARIGGNTLTFEGPQTYTGSTTLMGGTLTLENDATILNTSAITIRNATLYLNNNSSLQTSVSDRINDASAITLRDGTIRFDGKVQDMTTETLGAVSVFKGANTITVNTGGVGSGAIATAQLTIASLTRSAGTTINFTGTNLGSEGTNAKLIITTPLTTVANGALGAWAIGNTSDYAAYNQTNGVGWVGYGGFVGYDAGFGSGNITNLGMGSAAALTTTLSAGTTTTGLLRFMGGFTNDLEFTNSTDVLHLELGGILRSNNNNSTTIGTLLVPGVITSGVSELIVYNNQNTITINSVIQGATALVKSGAATLTLTNANTYTGGTTVAQGTLRLEGGLFTTVIPAGGLQINNATVTMVANNGQIDSSNDVTLTGSSTLTLAGGSLLDNTLNSITFDNTAGTGNPTVSIPTGSVLTLTSSAPVTVTTNNALTTPIISGGTLAISSGVNTISVEAPNIDGTVYTGIHRSLEISSVISGIGSSITKSGAGLVEFSGQSTFTGGINVTGGGIVLGANSSGTVANTLVSGPLGRGDVTMAAGTTLFVDDSSRTVGNAFNWTSTTVNPVFNNIGTSTDTMTLNGNLTFGTLGVGGLVANVVTPYLNVVLGGAITGIGSVTDIGGVAGVNTITKAGPGNIIGLNITGISNTANINLEGLTNGNVFTLFHDGDGTSRVETINLGTVTFEPVNGANLSLTIGRAGSGYYFPTATFKTLALTGLTSSVLPNGITLTNNNNYGLDIPNNIALASGNNWTVNNANTSLQPAGLILSGVLSGSTDLTKSGNGTLVLGNALNSFIGTIDITNGTVEAASNTAFGDFANIIQIGSNSLAEGLRISGTFATSRIINLNAASSGIDVTGANVFTLNNAFTFATATNALRKNDLGTLVLTQAQAGWDGDLTIGQGVLRITDGAALGTTTGKLIINNVGASLELPGGVTVADDIRIASTNNSSSNGPNSSGAIHSTGGVNTLTGAITIDTTTTDSNSRSGTLTADLGSTLNVEGGIVLGLGTGGSNRDNWIGFGGEGTINLTTTGITRTGANGVGTLTKFGSGTLNIQVANAFNSQQVVIKSGTLSINGAGTIGASTISAPGTVYLNPTGVLVLNNSGTPVNNRLSGRNINISGADLTIIGDSGAATSETVGTFTLREGTSYLTFDADAAQQLDFTTGTVARSAQATLIVRGDNLGDAAGAGVATIKGGAYVFIGQTGGTGSTNKSILPWAYGDTSLTGEGTFFLTADSAAAGANTGTNILRPLTAGEQSSTLTVNDNVNLTTNETLSSLTTINSLRLDAGGGVSLNYVPLTLDSGGMIVLAGNTGITGFSGVSYLTTTSNRELDIHTVGDLILTIPIAGTTGALTKSGPGTLTLAAGNTNHSTVMVNDGILKLGGGDQTILPGRNMWVNEGGILDLNGTVQQVNILESRQSAVLARNDAHIGGGTVINSSGTQATLAMAGSSSIFAGSIQGDIAVVRSNAANTTNDWNLYADQTYAGPTLFNGGRVILNNGGRLSATTSIELTNATLLITASANSTEPGNLTDRINDAATISLRGSMLQLRSVPAVYTTETFGAVTLGEGNSIIDFAEGGSAVNQTDATFLSLDRAAGSHATVRFLNIDATPNDDERLFINTLNGVATTNLGDGLSNNLIGGWAIFEREFASYIPGQGVGGLNTQGFAGYSPNVLDEGLATDNIRIVLPNGGLITTLTANRTVNSLNIQAPTTSTDDSTLDLGGNTLTLASGGLILSPVATTALFNNIAVLNGNLTAGTTAAPADLYLHALSWFNGQADNTGNADVRIGANIVDNAAGGSVTLVIDATVGRGTLLTTNDLFINGSNTYTGGTFVNAGQVRLNNGSADGTTTFAVPGDLTITGGYSSNAGSLYNDRTSTVFLEFDSQINEAATVTIMGGAILDLNGNNQTVANLVFNNHGGTTPQVTTGVGTLTVTGSSITASGQNVSSNATSTVNGKLALGSATTTITVNPVEWNSTVLNPILPNLIINASIEGEDIIKAGGGVLRLSGANAWTGNFDLQAGGLLLGNNSALSSGNLTIGNNTFLSSTADNRVIANDFTISGNFSLSDVFNLTLNGSTTLAAGNHTITVDMATKSLTLGGIITGSGSITKAGDGILVLGNNSNAYTGATTVNDGILRYGTVDAVPTGTALTVNEGGLVDITNGGSVVTVGSLAGNSATQGGVIYTGATSGTITFTAGANNTSTVFGGVIANAAGSTLNFVKAGTGTLTLGGLNAYNGSTTVRNGRLIALSVGGSSPLGTSQSLIMGGGSTSGILQIGDSSAPLDLTFTSLASAGTGTANQIVSGNAAMSTLTFNLSAISTFAGNIGGAGANEGNFNLVKDGPLSLVINGSGTSTYVGTTTVSGGKLFMGSTGAFPTTTTSLSVADGAQFALTGTSNVANQVYGFSGTGNRVTVGSSTGGALGFGIDGLFNTQLNIATGQTLTVNGTMTTAVYVNGTPTAGQDYVLINGVDAASISASGSFDLNPYVFNGGAFTYTLRLDSGVGGGGADQLVLTPTAATAATDAWWKGDLSGLGLGAWAATLSGTSNWDTDASSGIDTQVAPDSGSIVHFSATGAANFNTTLGANMTIKELIFHTGNAATTIGSSNGINTLSILGNTGSPTTGITLETGVGNVGISAIVALLQDQSWNIEDTARTLTLSGGLTGTTRTLTVNDLVTNAGSLIFSGTAATMTGTLAMNTGILVFDDTGSLNSGLNVVLGTGTTAATLQVGNTTAATEAIIGGLSNGAFAGSKVVGGNAAISTLSIGPASGSTTFSGALGGGGTNENNFNLEKTGAGTQIIDGAATYAGTTVVREGTLQLGSSSAFAPAGNLSVFANANTTATMDFNGKNYTVVGNVTLGGGVNGIAQFLDSAVTKGLITLPGNIVYDATNDPGAAVIGVNIDASGANSTITVGDSVNAAADLTLNGTYTITSNNSLTFNGAGSGVINGNISILNGTGTTKDVNFSSTGEWTINAKIEVTDVIQINTGVVNATVGESLDASNDVVVDGTGVQGSAIVNISSTSQVHTGDDIFIQNGGQINVTTSGGIGTGTDQLLIGNSASASAGAAGLLNLVSANISIGANGLLLGNGTNIGNITGTGIITTAGSKDLRNGSIDAGITLAGNGQIYKQNSQTVTFSGDRDVASTGNTNIREGNLILDYTTNNNSKIGAVLNLGLQGVTTDATLTLNGNASTATVQSVASTTILPGITTLALNNGLAQTLTLNLGAFTRSVVGGVLAFEYSTTDAKATSTSPAGTLGFATVKTGAGTERFAAIDGSGDIVQATFVTQNDPSAWISGQDIIIDGAVTGLPADCTTISSLTFTSTSASTLTISANNQLQISSGGIMVDAGLGAVDMKIVGGELFGSASGPLGEIIVHQNNALGALIIDSNIVNSAGITKTGIGRLVLSGDNSFIANGSQLNINEGIVELSGGNAIADNAGVFMRTGTTLAITSGSSETVGHLATTSGAVSIILGTAGQLTINQTANTTYTGVFTGGTNSVFTLNGSTFNFNMNATTTTAFTGSVVINSGLLQLSGNGRLANAKAFTINKGGNLLLDNNGGTRSGDRILGTATITLNSADGSFSGETRPRGLAIRSDQDSTNSEAVGVVTAASGASYVTLEATTANDDPDLQMTNLLRSNSATLNVRGTNLGTTNTQRAQFEITNAGNQTAFINTLVGGGGAAASKTISIVPWAIGQTFTGGLADTHMGNSLVTYVSGAGIRPLDLTTEYSTFSGAGGSTDNVRENLSADLTGLTTQTVNSLVINKNSTGAGTINVTGAGAGNTLTNTSGTFLFTQNTGAAASTVHSVILGGFVDGIQTAGGEYVFFVVNPSSATNTATLTATVASPLNTTGASVTKSGRGTLEFTAVNTYTGGTTVNEGTLLIHDNDNIGGTGAGTQGDITLAGGALSLASDYADDLGGRDLVILSGGGTIDTGALSVVATDLAISGSGDLTKLGTGTLQLAGTTATTHTGLTTVKAGTVELNNTTGNALGTGGVLISTSTAVATVKLLASNQIADTASVELTATSGFNARFDLNDFNETIGGLTMSSATTGGATVRTGATGVLTVAGDITFNNNRVNDGSTTEYQMLITGSGSLATRSTDGILDLGGTSRTITVQTTQTNPSRNDAVIETVIQNGGIIKEGSRALILSAANTYTGDTTVNNGELNLRSTGSLSTGAVTVSKDFGSLTDAAVLSGNGTIGGAVTIGDGDCGIGILAVGTGTGTGANYGVNASGTMTLTAADTALTVGNGSQIQMEVSSPTNGTTVTFINGQYEFNGGTYATAADLFNSVADNGGAAGADGLEALAIWNVAPTSSTNHDFLNLTGANSSLSVGTRASATFGDGSIVVSNVGFSGASYGQVFNLIDWQAMTNIGGTFTTGSSAFYDASSNVSAGDLDLLGLGVGLGWDVSAFSQYGIIVVVPEPSRTVLLLLGLMGLMFGRRRRRTV
ncbi:autotransporter-associated beta strand repeat-containing protein [Prosthecobacter sp.]|uniref:autotransporter-associated beta strand repeat-containing protein n=1 Tax=Prosthecobacter sp. TaxID=1965333 RepID=UPI001D4CB744|nr:autotransporter-associated beta strand repeat-containing protein [Prosthecobacter sp.]MCB1277100.1 autotransporter-associated beta strand repeat-containing protein [Prosthecobacter sp.]